MVDVNDLVSLRIDDSEIDDDADTIDENILEIVTNGERARDQYMQQIKQCMAEFKRLQIESTQDWPIICEPTDRIKQYYHSRGNVHYVKVKGKILCDDPRKIIIMERDYCWNERRNRWDIDFVSIVQNHSYECKGRGEIRLVSCETILPWWAELAGGERSCIVGVQWDRYTMDSESAMFLFESLDRSHSFGIHIKRITKNNCYITCIVKVTTNGLIQNTLFKRYYLPALKERLSKYEYVVSNWKEYYPNNGKIIR